MLWATFTYFKECFIVLRFMLLCVIFSSGNYEIHLPDISFGYVSLPHFPWPNGDFTVCFWLKTKQSGFFIEYEVAFSIKQNATLVLGLYFHNLSFEVLFGNIRRYQTTVSHCLLWCNKNYSTIIRWMRSVFCFPLLLFIYFRCCLVFPCFIMWESDY